MKSVIWDECQELRHTKTAKYNAAEFLANAVPYRMGLSATPIYNYGAEMFNVLECISPGQLGSRHEFITEWCGMYDESVRDPQAFGSYLRENGLMLRRTRKDVGRELPACQSIVQPIEVDLHALDRMQANCAELAKIILGTGEAFRGQKMKAAAELDWRLRQATGIAKAPYTAAFARMLVESGEKVLLYGWHREVYAIWLKQLEDLNPTLYTGSESASQKEFSKQRFIKGDAKVMCISLRSGAGLDGLQDVCSTVIFGELDWSPGVHEQNIGRVFRDGQPRPVFAYYLLADQGSDPVIADVLGIKTQQIDGLRDPDRELVERLEVDRRSQQARRNLDLQPLPLRVPRHHRHDLW